jgi:hypothetical protein
MGAFDTSAIEEELRTVGKSVFDRIVIEVLVNQRLSISVLAIVSSTGRLGGYGPRIFHPRQVVNMVDIKVAKATATSPNEAVETPDLVLQVAHIIWLLG